MTPKVGMSWLITRDGRQDRRVLTVRLPLATKSLTNMRTHWAAKARLAKGQRTPVALVMRTAFAAHPAQLPATVTLTRIAPRTLDDDNLRGALKSVRDGVADALGLDDRDGRVRWGYAQRKGQARELGIEIRYEPTGLRPEHPCIG